MTSNNEASHPTNGKEQEKEKTLNLNGKKAESNSKKQWKNPYQRSNLSKCFNFSVAKQDISPILVLIEEL